MVRRDLGADGQQPVVGDAELGELHLRLDLGDREATALGLRDVLHLGLADAELDSGVAVRLLGPMRHHLAALDLQHSDRHVLAGVPEDPGHADLLRDNT